MFERLVADLTCVVLISNKYIIILSSFTIVKHVKSVFYFAQTVPHTHTLFFSIVNYILMQSVSTAKRFQVSNQFCYRTAKYSKNKIVYLNP